VEAAGIQPEDKASVPARATVYKIENNENFPSIIRTISLHMIIYLILRNFECINARQEIDNYFVCI
jgi:hypothetical protein